MPAKNKLHQVLGVEQRNSGIKSILKLKSNTYQSAYNNLLACDF
jgi:hypothetical protein